ncbi:MULTISPECIES: SPOR domain-containing protein [unclassified Virgibacillus]|uniref:SPOR domain-containing protein n=1 Tax=unclassified Virgibacillus TaxID=2620237 RepID=UPI0024DECE1D|nr:SPOR domain-containing protein [Virgibacillus sp. LDC-1]
MNRKKPVVVKLNQKDVLKNAKNTFAKFQGESDSTENNKEVPSYIRKSSNRKHPPKKRANNKIVKPFLLSAISAVAVGLLLGFIMLNMFGNMGEKPSAVEQPAALTSDSDNKSRDSQKKAVNLIDASFGEMNAFVLQGGVFSQQENADVVRKQFEKSGYPAISWKKDTNFYVLVGLATTKQEAKTVADSMKENGFETYIKAWQVEEKVLQLTTDEDQWLQSFFEHWEQTAASITDDNVSVDNWNALMEQQLNKGSKLISLQEKIQAKQDKLSKLDQKGWQAFLLELWKEYASIRSS